MPTDPLPFCARRTWTPHACVARALVAVLFLHILSTLVAADAPSGFGAIEGRVFNPGTGEYLENARITIEGTSLETLTNSLGQYSFSKVPAGAVKVKAFYTGLAVEIAPVNVSPGQTAQHDFTLAGFDQKPDGAGGIVKLSQYVVSTSREMDGAAIAINEKRFAADIRNVIAADEFGPMADGNV